MDRFPRPAVESTLGDQLEELVRTYSRLVRSAIKRVGGMPAIEYREDIEQRVFLAIWKQVSSEQQIDHPASYIYRAAVRETIRVLKQERRHSPTDDTIPEAPDPTADPVERVKAREIAERIDTVLETLVPPRQRAVRARLLGLGVREIMKLEGWSYNRARNLIARGMADLRQGLGKQTTDV